jgi:hypothetical protein
MKVPKWEKVAMDDPATLRAELAEINQKCLVARDNEVRYALQRSRLESERATLLAKIVEATDRTTPAMPTKVAPSPASSPPATYRMVVQPSPAAPAAVEPPDDDCDDEPELQIPPAKRKLKPDGLPTSRQMVAAVLEQASPKWLHPKQIDAIVRETWWPDAPRDRIRCTVWGMARGGLVEKQGSRYRAKLNGHAHTGNGTAK